MKGKKGHRVQSFSRGERMSSLIQRELTELFRDDWDLQDIIVSRVELTSDCRMAKVYFRKGLDLKGLDENEQAQVLEDLERVRPGVQSWLGRNLKSRFSPKVEFFYDHAPEDLDHINELLKQVKSGE